MPDYDALLFDNDGVLVTPPSYDDHFAAMQDAFAHHGVDAPDDHVDAITFSTDPDRLRAIARHHDIDPAALWDARERFDERVQIEQFEAGARTLFDDVSVLDDLRQPCGLVSNNHHSTVEWLLAYFDLHDHFETYYGREMAMETLPLKKPNTHYVEQALADLDAEDALYVGDSETDLIAADRAGLDSVFVWRDHHDGLDLGVEPTFEVESLYGVAAIARS
ncbi:HAD family hydrolase [Halobacteriales archaeon Cl-PHB]